MTKVEQHPGDFGIGRLFWLTGEAIVGADVTTGLIVLWNPAAERLFGHSAADALGMPLEALVPDDLRQQHLDGVARYLRTGERHLVGGDPVEVPARRADGTPLVVSLTLTDVEQPESGRYVVAIVRDVTELRQAVGEQERLNGALREFVATASHDLRSPLSAVLGFSQTLLESDEHLPDETRRRCVQAIHRSALRAARLVDNLLMLSQIEAHALVGRPQAVGLREVTDEVNETLGEDVAGGASPIDVHIADGLTVLADPDHLNRIVTNLVSNARRHGDHPIVVEADRSSGVIEVRVLDAGPGVPEELVPRLFTPFARTGASADSTGLGLSIVRGLAEANNGTAFYERRGTTTCFGVRLPAG
ncbi:MAG: PAS domain-containing sensor histidine kinase [Actinomycetota bacterium]|nr:PAS domain-containing sensor histidine kinase [Actinomycetota bacterium]